MLRPVDLVHDVQAAVRRDHAQRDGLAHRLAELPERRAGELEQHHADVDLAGQADQLRAEQHAIGRGHAHQQTLRLERLDQPQCRRSR